MYKFYGTRKKIVTWLFVLISMPVEYSFSGDLRDVQFAGKFDCEKKSELAEILSKNLTGSIQGGAFEFTKTIDNSVVNLRLLVRGREQLELSGYQNNSISGSVKFKFAGAFVNDTIANLTGSLNEKLQQSNQCQLKISFDETPFKDSINSSNTNGAVTISQGQSDNSNSGAVSARQIVKDLITELEFERASLEKQFISLKQNKSEFTKNSEVSFKKDISEISVKLNGLSPKLGNDVTDQIKKVRKQISDLEKQTIFTEQRYNDYFSKLEVLSSISIRNSERLEKQILQLDKKLYQAEIENLASLQKAYDDFKRDIGSDNESVKQQLSLFKNQTSQSLNEIEARIENLDGKIAQLQTDQKSLEEKQLALEFKQNETEKKVDVAREIFSNILLPISEDPKNWMLRVAAVPIQQQQFCRIVDHFYNDLAKVYKTKNEIKRNAIYRDRQQDLAALLPGGAINSWVVRVVEVFQAKDGSAAVMLQPPCRAMLGSDACSNDNKKIRATIPPDSLMYRELSRLNSDDFVVISGKILYAEVFEANAPLPTYAVYAPSTHCSAIDGAKDQDVFITELSSLVLLR